MLATRHLRPETAVLFQEFYRQTKTLFPTLQVTDITLPTGNMALFDHYSGINYDQSLLVNEARAQAYVTVLQVTYDTKERGVRKVTEFQPWGFVYLPQDFGQLVIRRETLLDKLMEVVTPLETNFPEDPDFCKKNYVLIKTPDLSRPLFTNAFRALIKDLTLRPFQLEVNGHWLSISENRQLGQNDTPALAKFVHAAANLDFSSFTH